MILSNVPNELREKGRCLIQTSGISMEPLLHDHCSTVVLETITRPLEIMDVVLFQRSNGDLVLHRIVDKKEDHFIICGDNTLQLEPVTRSQILGIMTGYYPDQSDRFVTVDLKEDQKHIKKWWMRYRMRHVKVYYQAAKRKVIHFVRK